MLLNDLLIDIAKVPFHMSNIQVKRIVSDSSIVQHGDLFIGLKGITNDGAKFANDAIKAGAVAVLVSNNSDIGSASEDLVIRCNNIREVVKLCCEKFYAEKPELLIGVTGSFGKSSILCFIRQMLERANIKAMSLGSTGIEMNSNMGTKVKGLAIDLNGRTTQNITVNHDILSRSKTEYNIDAVVIEMSSHALYQGRVEGIVLDVAIFCSLEEAHLDYHKNIDNYMDAKMLIFSENLKPNGIAIIYSAIPNYEKVVDYCLHSGKTVITFGYRKEDNVRIISDTIDNKGQTMEFKVFGKSFKKYVKLIGGFQITNIAATIACIVSLNIVTEMQQLDKLLNTIVALEGRMQLVGTKSNGGRIYIDYMHTISSFRIVLEDVRKNYLKPNGRIIGLYGFAPGKDMEGTYKMIDIAAELCDNIIITEDNIEKWDLRSMCRLIEDRLGDDRHKCIGIIYDRDYAIRLAINILGSDDILLLIGKGHERYMKRKDGMEAFDEFKIVDREMPYYT